MLPAELNNTSYLILGMLATHPKSGYDIKAIADHSTRHFWAISYGQIYPELTRLTELGYAELESESTAGRARRVFRITAKGRVALTAWLEEQGPDTFELRDELWLKLFFAQSPETKLRLVRRMRARHQALMDTLHGIEARVQEAPHRKAGGAVEVLRAGFRLQEAYLAYCDEMEKQLTGGRKQPAHSS